MDLALQMVNQEVFVISILEDFQSYTGQGVSNWL